nr:DUF6531 domain-containing protein [Paeniglutamicibacter quisquiliarum]
MGAFEHDVEFDFGTANALIGAFRAAASKIEGQAGSRSSLVSAARTEFKGHFSQLFADNAGVASSDASELAARLREAADGAKQLKEQAHSENERRRLAREWKQRKDERDANIFLNAVDAVFGEEDPPVGPPSAPVSVQASEPRTGVRQTPNPGNGGGGGGTSAARPSDLRTFATGSANLNSDLAGTPGSLRGHLADFSARCSYGRLSAGPVVRGFEKWLEANEQDVLWARTIADAFAAAGGEGNVSQLSNAALLAALASQGVGASRQDLTITPAQAYGGPPTTGYSNDPVNTSTGNFLEPEVDLGFAGAAANLAATRMYNSLSEATGVFGPGWASIFEVRLELDDEGASLVLPDGREVRFPRLGEGWDRADGENWWLQRHSMTASGEPARDGAGTPDADTAEVLVASDNAGARWVFTASGTWLSTDRGPGSGITALHDAHGRITGLEHERGRWVSAEYSGEPEDGGRITRLEASDGRRVDFSYDASGQLVAAAGPGGTRTYRWNDVGLIEAVIDAAGVAEAVNTYDDRRRVLTQVSAFGRTTRFAYLPGRLTVVSDEDGTRSNTWIADAKGRLVGVIDGQDNRQSMGYDRWGNLVSATERDGSLSVHAYDERGRRIRTLTPTGAEFNFGYDAADRPLTVVSGTGAVVTYEYPDDAARNPSVVIDPEGGRTELEWNHGLLARITDPTGVVMEFAHDRFGDLKAISNAFGNTARLHRDEAGRVTEAVSPGGARTSYLYDGAGRLTSRRDADGALWRFEYAPGGALAVITDPLGARTVMEHGAHGQLERTVDPLGRAVARRFDDLGQVASLQLPDGAEWRFAHDTLSRLTGITDPEGNSWVREYGVNGELSAVVDPTGVRQEFSVDPAAGAFGVADEFERGTLRCDEYGRPVASEQADGSSELATYDLCGRVVELVDGEGGLTRLERDAAGRVTAQVSPTGAVTRIEYDAAGRPCANIDASGARTTLAYNADSRIVARTFPDGQSERIRYDAMGRVISRSLPARGTARYDYDKAGRLTGAADAVFGMRRFRYDAAGQLTEAVNGLGGVTRYEYDERGRLVSSTDPLGSVVRRSYDQGDRVVSETDPLGRTTTAGYDTAGRPLWQQAPDGQRLAWGYDAAGRAATTSVDGQILVQVERDARERAVRITDGSRPDSTAVLHELRFNRRGQLVSRTRDGAGVAWEYDADGRRTALLDPQGTRTGYRHDAAGRLAAVEHPVFGTITYAHDAAGKLLGATAGDILQAWDYEAGALVRHTVTTPDGVQTTELVRDADGRIAAIRTGGAETRYAYDGACQLERMQEADGTVTTWRYDAAGRMVAETANGHTTASTYDAAGQLLATATGAGRTEYTYDASGRRTAGTGPDGATRYGWSGLGTLRTVEHTDPQGSGALHTLWVDALGELAEVDGTALWWDTAEYAPRVVSIGERSVTALPGGLAAVDGSLLGAGWRGAHPTEATNPWAMAAGTVPGLPAGLGIGANGGVQVAGLDWLGARAYDPATRGFLSVDPLDPVAGAGWASNPYSYAGNDPLHAIDPLGLRPVTEAELAAYRESNNGALAAAGDWMSENWEYVAGGAMVVAGGVLMATGVGGPVGMALIGAGADVIIQKATTGDVNWGQTAVMAVTGGLGGAVMAGRMGALGVNGVRAAVAEGVAAGATSGGAGNAYTYGTGPGPHTPLGYLQATGTGIGMGAATGGFGAGAGTYAGRALLRSGPVVNNVIRPLTTRPDADTAIMGRWMDGRVTPFADATGAGYYNGTPARIRNLFETSEGNVLHRPASWLQDRVDLDVNRLWIRSQMAQGKNLTDIGVDLHGSPFYQMERVEVNGYRGYTYAEQPNSDLRVP